MEPHAPFKVIATKHIDHDHRNLVSLLYLPMIGSDAMTLYFSLYALTDRSSLKSLSFPHKFLYDLTHLTINFLETARKKLEACGLLETFQREDEIIYELFLPMNAERFIKDSPFAPYLIRQLGEERFFELADLFKVQRPKLSAYTNISASFSEVFKPAFDAVNTKTNYQEATPSRIRVEHPFNIELFLEGFPETLIHPTTKTTVIKERLALMAYIYSLDETTMKDLLLQSLNKDTSINFEGLHRQCQSHYSNTPKQSFSKINVSYDLDYITQVHPKTLVEDLTGMHVPAADLKIIEQLISKTHLKLEVINVLIAFVLHELNHQFPVYNYFEKVVAEWKRAGVDDAESAIEHIKTQRNRKNKPKTTRRKFGKELPEDIKVDWFEAYLKKLEEEES